MFSFRPLRTIYTCSPALLLACFGTGTCGQESPRFVRPLRGPTSVLERRAWRSDAGVFGLHLFAGFVY